jgi:hypothetical protein
MSIDEIALILLVLIALKSIIMGSDFNFIKWIKHGEKYMKQYEDWQEMKP